LESNAEKRLGMLEVADRQKHFGSNCLPEVPPRGVFMRLLAQFHNLLIYVLLGAALIAGAMGHWVDSIVILGVVLAMIGLTAWARPAMRQPGPGEAHAQ
jgi:magnesium-transporting ATPase (P-type)